MSERGRPRVAITGMGAICGLGHTLPEVWNNIIAGKSGISMIEQMNVTDLPVKIGGEVKNFIIAENIISAKDRDKYDRFIHFALHSIYEAMGDSGLLDANQRPYTADRMGCIMGVGMGGFPFIEASHHVFLQKGSRRVTPFFIPSVIPNMTSGLATINLGLKGVNYSISSACASAGHAISAAATEIILGTHDVVITGGAESVMCNLPLSGFASMKALSKRNEEPQRASRPFDADRDGFVMGEGAGILVLENYEKAKARGAKIYAELVGFASSSDAYHITAPHPDGEGATTCMTKAIAHAGITPEKIGYINAHGTSTPLGDIGETKAIKASLGAHAYKTYISSTKSMVGHLLGAAGGVETIFCAMALHTGVLPPTMNLEKPDPDCDLNYIPNEAIKKEVQYALNNSFGFGGTNSALVLKRTE
jgi:3-oxoacyl-[acyl-carrier-protein] synthase II